jgi:hypothetical protein
MCSCGRTRGFAVRFRATRSSTSESISTSSSLSTCTTPAEYPALDPAGCSTATSTRTSHPPSPPPRPRHPLPICPPPHHSRPGACGGACSGAEWDTQSRAPVSQRHALGRPLSIFYRYSCSPAAACSCPAPPRRPPWARASGRITTRPPSAPSISSIQAGHVPASPPHRPPRLGKGSQGAACGP